MEGLGFSAVLTSPRDLASLDTEKAPRSSWHARDAGALRASSASRQIGACEGGCLGIQPWRYPQASGGLRHASAPPHLSRLRTSR